MASENKASPFAGLSFIPGEIYDVKKNELLPYHVDLTLDPNTVNYCLSLSEDKKQATYGAWQKYPLQHDRFDAQPQVMAKDALQGIHYWEVEWSDSPNESVYVGVAYDSIERKGPSSEFGKIAVSWVFGQTGDPSGSEPKLKACHNSRGWEVPLPTGGCKRVGVLLDWPGGTLSFSKVSGNQKIALYKFETKFTEPVFPCFWVGKSGNYVALRPAS